jgi:hypothetical protein
MPVEDLPGFPQPTLAYYEPFFGFSTNPQHYYNYYPFLKNSRGRGQALL